jgi:hypothetical protein
MPPGHNLAKFPWQKLDRIKKLAGLCWRTSCTLWEIKLRASPTVLSMCVCVCVCDSTAKYISFTCPFPTPHMKNKKSGRLLSFWEQPRSNQMAGVYSLASDFHQSHSVTSWLQMQGQKTILLSQTDMFFWQFFNPILHSQGHILSTGGDVSLIASPESLTQHENVSHIQV